MGQARAEDEVRRGERFAFGENWRRFLERLNEDRIAEAQQSLCEMLEVTDLKGTTFLDVGSGSGLFSLAARRLGARVHSFDFDPASVGCTLELRSRFFPGDGNWTIEQGSALDEDYLKSLGQFDVVYAWGVLHHTGNMWKALDLVAGLVKPQGKLFIAIYNDQGRRSRCWLTVKKAYCRLPRPLKPLILLPVLLRLWGLSILRNTFRGKPLDGLTNYHGRGMSAWRDLVDWVGGYPFEVARPDEIFHFYRQRGFTLVNFKSNCGLGNNQFVFQR